MYGLFKVVLRLSAQSLVAIVLLAAGEIVIDKPGYSAFAQTDLDQRLRVRDIDTLLLCGITTEVCVSSTLRAAVDRG